LSKQDVQANIRSETRLQVFLSFILLQRGYSSVVQIILPKETETSVFLSTTKNGYTYAELRQQD